MTDSRKCEVLVIGSGPGGAITAALLAEAGKDVLLVESGRSLTLDSCKPFTLDEMVQKYCSGGITAGLGKTKVSYVEGHCVGGGSEINAGLYHRTPAAVLDEWRDAFDVREFDEDAMLPHFEACERDVNVSYLPGAAPAASLRLKEGAEKLGWQALEIPRWFKHDESGGGRKQSMTETFVPRAVAAGCTLLPDTRVRKLRRTGARWEADAGRVTIEADTVFVACGAVRTPALLRRSGIKRNVGNSLQFHPTVKLVARFPEEVNSDTMGVPVHQVKEFSPRLSFGCSISTAPYQAVALIEQPEHLASVNRDWRRIAVYYAMIRGGVGTVRALPFFDDPLVRFKIGGPELADLADGMKKLGTLLLAAGAETLFPTVKGMNPLRNQADLDAIPEALPPGRTALMTIHTFASCPMGEKKDRSATDSFGRVHGMDGLYIADGSLLGGAPGVNPQGSIMAVVRRNAVRFLGLS